jgi:hypothetical protein
MRYYLLYIVPNVQSRSSFEAFGAAAVRPTPVYPFPSAVIVFQYASTMIKTIQQART